MRKLNIYLLMYLLSYSTLAFSRGGDDVGNGGFAYKQSVIILKMAASDLESKIKDSTLKDIVDHPERRVILQDTLTYDDLDKMSKKNKYRGGRKLAMNYTVNPPSVIILKPYFEAFMGRTDSELKEASLEVQKRLLHEASHIWGYKEEQSEEFAKAFLENSRNEDTRPTNDISFGEVCSCRNGKSDLLSDCDQFCKNKPYTSDAILYVNTILGNLTISNPKLGNLYNWCNVQLRSDEEVPQCFLEASDGQSEQFLPINLKMNSNSFIANINSLNKNKTWILKIRENKSRSNAQTKSYQIRRSDPIDPDEDLRPLDLMSVSQYSCLNYGSSVDSNGEEIRDNSKAKISYYYPLNQVPAPIPTLGHGSALTVCHDEEIYPGIDSILYPRLDLVESAFNFWDIAEPRFRQVGGSNSQLLISSIIERRMKDEYNISGVNLNLFMPLFFSSPTSIGNTLGYVMLPFTDSRNGRAFCPNSNQSQSNDPLFKILDDYVSETEGLYLAEKEGESIKVGSSYKIIYGTMLVSESALLKNGFFIQNGLKIKVTSEDLHKKTIFYYWPFNSALDPLSKGDRKLFTIRSVEELTGKSSFISAYQYTTSDKRIACIPKK